MALMMDRQIDFDPPVPLREAVKQAKYDRLDLIVYAPGDIPGEEETALQMLANYVRAKKSRAVPIEKALRRYGENLCYSIADYPGTKTTSCIISAAEASKA